MFATLKRIRSRIPNVALGVIIGLLVGGGAFAVAQTTGGGVHGGPNPRFHDRSECNLVDVRQLEGNWTHGDYVSAVEKENPTKVREAAHSRCGKPDKGARGPNNRGKPDNAGKPDDDAKQGAKPSPKPTKSEKPSPSPEPSATGTASPVVPEETATPSSSPSTESSTATP